MDSMFNVKRILILTGLAFVGPQASTAFGKTLPERVDSSADFRGNGGEAAAPVYQGVTYSIYTRVNLDAKFQNGASGDVGINDNGYPGSVVARSYVECGSSTNRVRAGDAPMSATSTALSNLSATCALGYTATKWVGKYKYGCASSASYDTCP